MNILIIAPPGAGKTTLLRDLVAQLSKKNLNILVSDERNEVACVKAGNPFFDLGDGVDVMSNADKEYVFQCAIRTMSPDVIVCDEIFGRDIEHLETCTSSGVNIIATLHAEDLKNAKVRLGRHAISLFDRFILLSKRNMPGEIVGIFSKEDIL